MLGFLLYFSTKNIKKQIGVFLKTAEALHLNYNPSVNTLTGQIENFGITVTQRNQDNNLSNTIELVYTLPGYEKWGISKENFFTKLQSHMGNPDVQIGDEAFDRECLLEGDATFLRSILNETMRSLIFSLHQISENFTINHSHIMVDFKQNYADTPTKLERIIHQVVSTARILAGSQDLFTRCLDNALHDSKSGVRMYNLEILKARFADRPETDAAIEAALTDAEQDLQVYAGILKGKAGLPYLAVFLEDSSLTPDNMRKIISQFRKFKYRDALSSLLECYNKQPDGKVRIEILKGLQEIGDSSVVEFIFSQLNLEEDFQIQLALTDTLGYCAPLTAVEDLYKMEKVTLNPLLKNSLRGAIARIQERSGAKGGKGWLSISETAPKEGGLSLPEGEEGGLSMTEEK